MTRYADPRRCPDCSSAIGAGDPACRSCGLSLRGETAQRLFSTLSLADDLLGALRATSAPLASAPAVSPAPTAALSAYPVTHPVPRRAPGRSRLGSASVPTILLGLGAGCLLVAALVFLAVTWSALGVAGRTATLVVLTVVAAGLAATVARRGLRAAAESLALVALGLLALDVVGADNAGWFGDLSSPGLLVLLGGAVALCGGGAAALAARTTTVRLVGGEVVAALGAGLVSGGVAAGAWAPVAPSLVLAVLVAAAGTAVAHRVRLEVATVGVALVTGVAWLSLAGYGVERVATSDLTWRTLWLALEVWPLLVAVAVVAALAPVHRLPMPARVSAAAVAHLLLAGALLAPVAHLQPTVVVLVVIGVLAVLGAVAGALPYPWGVCGVLTQAVLGGGVLVLALGQLALAGARLVDASAPVWAGAADDRLPGLSGVGDAPAAWLPPLCVLAVLGTGWALVHAARLDTWAAPAVRRAGGAAGVVAALLVGSAVGALALYPVPVWLVAALLAVAAVGFVAWSLPGAAPAPLLLAATYGAAAIGFSLHAPLVTAGVLLPLLAAAAVVHLRARTTTPSGIGGATLAALLAGSVWAWGTVAEVDGTWTALAGVLLLGAVVLLAPYAPERWWTVDDAVGARTGLELGSAVAAVALCTSGLTLAPLGDEATWAAVYLTSLGVVAALASLLRDDRRRLGWAGGVLLAAATWVRLADLGVQAPEAYTLPSAAALLAVGLLRLRRDPATGTVRALAPGLSLAVLPSLLWVLDDPTGVRVLLLGLGCLVLVTGGARLGWTAPLAVGAVAGALLVLRLAAPSIEDAVPRWVLLGAAGTLLVTVGTTWERRVQDARALAGYVRALR